MKSCARIRRRLAPARALRTAISPSLVTVRAFTQYGEIRTPPNDEQCRQQHLRDTQHPDDLRTVNLDVFVRRVAATRLQRGRRRAHLRSRGRGALADG